MALRVCRFGCASVKKINREDSLKKHFGILIFILWLAPSVRALEQKSLSEKLGEDYLSGQISRTLYLAYHLIAAENPEKLPAAYRNCPITHDICSTLRGGEARAHLDSASGAEKSLLAAALSRPDVSRLPLRLISPKGNFCLHFTTAGSDSATEAFVAEAARTFDYVYDLLIHEMGYHPPPDDLGGGGTPQLDVYIMQFSLYGETRFEQSVPGSNGQRYTSFIIIDNDFFGSAFKTQGVDALHVTAAHEFFHMVQGGYRYFPSTSMDSRFLFEASSVWFEEVAFDEVNDYLQYVQTFLNYPSNPFHVFSNTTYGLGLYMIMLEKRHHRNTIRRIWQGLYDQEPLPAWNAALAHDGEQIGLSLAHFAVWNGFTAGHADTVKFYPEADLYPPLTTKEKAVFMSTLVIEGNASELVTQYYCIEVPMGGVLQITPSLKRPADWMYSVAVYDPAKSDSYKITAGNGRQIVGPLSPGSELQLAITNISWPTFSYARNAQSFTFTLSAAFEQPSAEEGIYALSPAPFVPARDQFMQIQFILASAEETVTLYILSENGRKLIERELHGLPPGANCYFWDGRDANGLIVPSGIYLCHLRSDNKSWPLRKFAVMQ